MAWSASGLYVKNFIDILDASQLAINLVDTTADKWALFNNSVSAEVLYGTATAYTTTNEVSGTGYTAGGQTVASPTLAQQGDLSIMMYDMGDQTWTTATVTAYGAILYSTQGSNSALVGLTFGGAYTSTAGNFTIAFSTNGVFTIDLY